MNIWQHLYDHFVPHARNNYKPHILAQRSLSLYAGFLISVKALTLFSLAALPTNQAFSSSISAQNIIDLTNYSRASFGEPGLHENGMLDAAAQAKAEDMLKNQYFNHVSPSGITPWDFITNSGYNYIIAGENLAINFYSSEGVEQAWMNSPEHRANILNKDFEDIGIGIATGQFHGENAVFVVQMFGTSLNQPILVKPGYTRPLIQNASLPEPINLPNVSLISLDKPLINDPGFVLTNQKDFLISGEAAKASSIYIFINDQPRYSFPVQNGIFSGKISLIDGDNKIFAVAFSGQAVSPRSSGLDLKLDTSVPVLMGGNVTPEHSGLDSYYKIDVQMSPDTVKAIASLGSQNIMLQPTANPNVWEGSFKALPGLQGNVNISAYDLAGNSSISRLATFSGTVLDNFGFLANHNYSAQILGKNISLNSIQAIYVYFIIGLLFALVLAIAIKPHIQHLSMIAGTSGVVMVALLMLLI